MIFALHPIHTEAVSGIVGRADVLSAIFFLLALLAFKGHEKATKDHQKSEKCLTLTVLSAACAMFCKEQGVTVLGVCLSLEALKAIKVKRPRWPLGFLLVSTVGLLALRGQLMGFSPPKFAKADNPASASDSVLARGLTFLFLPAFNVWLALCPNQLSFDWSMDAVPLITTWTDPRNAFTLSFYLGLCLLLYKARKVY